MAETGGIDKWVLKVSLSLMVWMIASALSSNPVSMDFFYSVDPSGPGLITTISRFGV
ncbi:MAG: hypothetical protein Q7T80_17240 [Methanoregula sp.]|nr:hypothetical protein [Methanoregula sp.]